MHFVILKYDYNDYKVENVKKNIKNKQETYI